MAKHSFQDTVNPFRGRGCQTETTTHFLFPCPQFSIEQRTLLNKIKSTDTSTLHQSDFNLTKTLLFGDPCNSTKINTLIINTTIGYVLNTKRFYMPLF